eukprot:TRINITY_DN15670_c0_g1_i1.p1 TRINITY_DN15670_c0_g1~~TRINITY_DN15670_c0_g1_i1.p1  ORF type:complete len:218 (+),score=35.66 TRINITY_DN15670_c0_g1_i1:120-773(+)
MCIRDSNKILILIICLIVAKYSQATTFGIYDQQSINDYECFFSSQYQFQQIACYFDNQFQSFCISNIVNAQQFGIESDIYISPSGTVDPNDLATQIFQKYSGQLFSSIYINIEQLSLSSSDNCAYVQTFASNLEQNFQGIPVGIYGGSQSDWSIKFGGIDSCSNFVSLSLAYYDLDNTPSFDDWSSVQFGGWSAPYEKYFMQSTICGQTVYSILRQE